MKSVITFAEYSDPGGRPVNEDSICSFVNGQNHGFVLCDGLGGMGMGDQASRLVVQVFQNMFMKAGKMSHFLPEAFQAAQDVLTAEQKHLHAEERMKTTAVAMVTDQKKLYVGHIGDSRAYLFKDNKVLWRTLDHSIPQMLALTGEIQESEIRNHKNRSIILRTMGITWDEPMYELAKPVSISKCDAVLLCSDGFWELIEDEDMCVLLSQARSPREWLDEMASVVKRNGAGRDMDNNSAIAVWIAKE